MDTDQSVNISSTEEPDEAASRVRRPHDRAREIARAALELFVTKGFAATKLEDVAKAAGVSKGLPYLYFRSKEDLLKANELVDQFEGTTEALFRELVAKFRQFAESPMGGVVKLILAEAGNFPDVARFYCSDFDLRGRELFAKTLRRGVARGEFRPIADIDMTAIIVAQPLAMHSIWLRSLAPYEPRPHDGEQFYTAYLDFVLKGLKA